MPYYPDPNPYYGSSQLPSYYMSSSPYSPTTSRITSPYSFSYMSPISAMLSASIGTNPLPRGLRSYSPMLSVISETSSSPLVPRRDISGHRNSPRHLPKTYFRQPRPVTIDTENIDLTRRNKPDYDEESTPGAISRGRTTVRMHTKKLKDNPLPKKKKTQAELLMEKYLIKDKPSLQEEDAPKRKRVWEEREEEVRNEPVRSGTIKRTNTVLKKSNTQLTQPKSEQNRDMSSQRKMSSELLKAEAALFDCMIQEELGLNSQKEMDPEKEVSEKCLDDTSLRRKSKREQFPYVRIKSSHSVVLDENGLPIEKRKSRALKKKSSKVLSLDELNKSSYCLLDTSTEENVSVKPKRKSTKKRKPLLFKIDALHVEEKSSPKLLRKFNYEVIVEECNKVHDKPPCQSEEAFNNEEQKDIPKMCSNEVLAVEDIKKTNVSAEILNDDENTSLSRNVCDKKCDIIADSITKLQMEVNNKTVEATNKLPSNDLNAQNNDCGKKEERNVIKKTGFESKKIVKGYLRRQKATERQDQSSVPPFDNLKQEKTVNVKHEFSDRESKSKGSCLDKSISCLQQNEVSKLLNSGDNVNFNVSLAKFDHSKSSDDVKNSYVNGEKQNVIRRKIAESESQVPIPFKSNCKNVIQSQNGVLGNSTSVLSITNQNNKQFTEENHKEESNFSLPIKDSTLEKGKQILGKIAPKSAPATPVFTKKVSCLESGNINQDIKFPPAQTSEVAKILPSNLINNSSSTNNCSLNKTQATKNLAEDVKEGNLLIPSVKSIDKPIPLQKNKASEFDQKFSNTAIPKSAPTTPILSKKSTAQLPINAATVKSSTNNISDLLGSIEQTDLGKNNTMVDQNNKASSLQTYKNSLLKSVVSAQKKEESSENTKTGSNIVLDSSPTNKDINESVLCEELKSKKLDTVKTLDLSETTIKDSLVKEENKPGLAKSSPASNLHKDQCLNLTNKNKDILKLHQPDTNINMLKSKIIAIASSKEEPQLQNIKRAVNTKVVNANLNKDLSNPDKNDSKLIKNETLTNKDISTLHLETDAKSLKIKEQHEKTKNFNLQSTDYKEKDFENLSKISKVQSNKKTITSSGTPHDSNVISEKKELNKQVQNIDDKVGESKIGSHLKERTGIFSNCANLKTNTQNLNDSPHKLAPIKTGAIPKMEKVSFEKINSNMLNNVKTGGGVLATSEKPKSTKIDDNKRLLGKIGKIDQITEISVEEKGMENSANAVKSDLKSDNSKESLEQDKLKKGVNNQNKSKIANSNNSYGNSSHGEPLTQPKIMEYTENQENKFEMSQSKCSDIKNDSKPFKSELSEISKQLKQKKLVVSNETELVNNSVEQLENECKKPNTVGQKLKYETDEKVALKKDSKKKRIKSESDVPEDLDNDLNQNYIENNTVINEDEKKSKSLKETKTEKTSKKKKKSKDKKSSKEEKGSKSPKQLKETLISQDKFDKKLNSIDSQQKDQMESSSKSDVGQESSEQLDISTVELSNRSTRLMHFINKCVKLSSDNESLSIEISDEDLSTSSSSDYTTDSECTSDSEESSTSDSECDVNCHRKCEKLMPNLCGVNQKLIVEALSSLRKGSSSEHGSRDHGSPTRRQPNAALSLDEEKEPPARQHGRITPPATTIPKFRKYAMDDFQFLKVLGKGSFGKVLLAELRGTQYYYAVKCLKKDVVLEDDDVECTLIERKVLALGTNHPYLCHLFCTFQTDSHLFFVMEYLNGGDLMFHIQQQGRFDEGRARFYAAEIVSGLKFLHKKGIVYRDLKLDNILLDFDGHVRIADFGMCKLQIFLDRTADTFCGTPDYMAPEIIKGLKYNQCVDWWSFGILMYEMLVGQSPFSGCDEDDLFWCICNRQPHYPRFITVEAKRILTQLLEKEANKRLGSCENGAQEVMGHPFFNGLDWERLERRELVPPFKPNVKHPLDVHYFDKHFTAERACLTPIDPSILQSMDQAQFQGFSYTNPNVTE